MMQLDLSKKIFYVRVKSNNETKIKFDFEESLSGFYGDWSPLRFPV